MGATGSGIGVEPGMAWRSRDKNMHGSSEWKESDVVLWLQHGAKGVHARAKD